MAPSRTAAFGPGPLAPTTSRGGGARFHRVLRLALILSLIGPRAVSGQPRPIPPIPAILNYPANVRSAGLAGAGVAMTGYAGSVFNNPSALAPIRRLSIEASLARLPDRSTYTMGAAAVRIGQFNVGGGYQYLRFPNGHPVTDNVTGAATGVYRRGGISLGTSAKYLSLEDSAGVVTRSMTSDLGATVALFDIAAFALSVDNLAGGSISNGGLRLPRSWHLGFSFNLLDTYSNGRLLATVETVWTDERRRRTVLGLEAGAVFYGVGLVARIGHGRQPGDLDQTLSKTAYGASVVLGQVRVDYAYQERGILGHEVHLFGVRWTP